jgi:hypothetical protein
VLEEGMMEVECPSVTPEVVRAIVGGSLRASCIVMLDHIELGDVTQLILSAYAPHLVPATAAEPVAPPSDLLLFDDEGDDGEQWLDGAESLTADSPLVLKLSSMLEKTHLADADA